MYFKPLSFITELQIAQEWDAIAEKRDLLISEGKDISLLDVTEPYILDSISGFNSQNVLDCGCGTGHLTSILSNLYDEVVGVDISKKSIAIAKKKFGNGSSLNFVGDSIQNYAIKTQEKFGICTANMVLMDTPCLNDVLSAVSSILLDGGIFSFTITHPCFWPIYWNYFNHEQFDYQSEIAVSYDFKVSMSNDLGITTHIHRPVSTYLNACINNGFKILSTKELYPRSSHIEINYKYSYPRFLGVLCRKI